MSLARFQSLLARLVTDADFRRDARSNPAAVFTADDLTVKERDRLEKLLDDRALDLTATLISSYRLGKILSLLPLTRVLLGDRRIGREANRFWTLRPPTSFYALEEAIAFCDYLARRRDEGLRVSYLSDVLALERAILELRRPGGRLTSHRVQIQYDVTGLLPPLTLGKRPHRVRKRPCALLATIDTDGSIDWLRA
jgi:hypothetical protein